MPTLISNIDPQIHSINGKLKRIINEIDDAEVIEKECITEQDVIDFAGNADAILTARAPITGNVVDTLYKSVQEPEDMLSILGYIGDKRHKQDKR